MASSSNDSQIELLKIQREVLQMELEKMKLSAALTKSNEPTPAEAAKIKTLGTYSKVAAASTSQPPISPADTLRPQQPKEKKLKGKRPETQKVFPKKMKTSSKGVKIWKVSEGVQLTKEQSNRLTFELNNGVPASKLRAYELEYHRENQLNQREKEKYSLGLNLERTDLEAPVKMEFFEERCPEFFVKKNRWINIRQALDDGNLNLCFRIIFGNLWSEAIPAIIGHEDPIQNYLDIINAIPSDICDELINGGFIRKIQLGKETTKMLKKSKIPGLPEFTLYLEKHQVTGVEIFSISPKFLNRNWKNIREFMENPPKIIERTLMIIEMEFQSYPKSLFTAQLDDSWIINKDARSQEEIRLFQLLESSAMECYYPWKETANESYFALRIQDRLSLWQKLVVQASSQKKQTPPEDKE
ncbi:hypothetical protein [Viola yellow mottle virus]|uniref:Uncharacterized protein n=1 Tax=Viola yellow mottle virus TaxID=2922803 RepID=A0A976QV12_9VIRU|nr:hypothetical protein [Viola yellow mottle virus]